MRKLISSILLLTVAYSAAAQGRYENILTQIEQNSTTLQALREQRQAQKLANRTGIYLANPEVEFNYLWGSPSAIGNRTDFAISQSFDFPTAYGHRNQISKLENENVELTYKSERIDLLLSAKQICVELVYYNALAREYEVRLRNARQIAAAYKTKMEKGDANAIENNKAQLNLTAVQNEVEHIETQRLTLLSELKRMNGGQEIAFTQSSFSHNPLPDNFDNWYSQAEQKSPILQYVSGQIRIEEEHIKLNRAMGLPRFSAGYISEKVVGERFQGASFGVSIPLWENKNTLKQAKAQAKAAESVLEDTKLQFYNRLQNLYTKASNLQKSAAKYRNALSDYNNEALLQKALDAGEITLLTYLVEIEYYYDGVNSVLEAEKELELAIAELSAVEL